VRHTNVVVANGDSGAVGLISGAVNKLEVVRVGDELVAGDNVLGRESTN